MDHTTIALGRVWTLVAGVLAGLSGLPGLARGMLDGAVWGRAFAELRMAEGAARRAIFAIADAEGCPRPPLPSAMTPERGAAPDRVQTPEPEPGAAPAATRAPAAPFRLSDPITVPPMDGAPLPSSWPSSWPPTCPAPGDGPRLPALHSAEGLMARMAALEAVLTDPGPAVARCLKLRARPRPHIFARSWAPRLRPGNPPGYVRKRRMAWDMDVLMEIHLLATQAAPPPAAPGPPGASGGTRAPPSAGPFA
ncbi:MAG: hypothetical protein AAF486_01100 [Pseudomonadota bacterium]